MKRPPSENESGVTFTTPMTSGLPGSKKNLPALRPGDFSIEVLRCRRRRGLALRAAVARRRLGGLRARGLGRPRRLARHDVGDLVGVDRFPLEQRLGHRLDLVAVVLEPPARELVLGVDAAADL